MTKKRKQDLIYLIYLLVIIIYKNINLNKKVWIWDLKNNLKFRQTQCIHNHNSHFSYNNSHKI